MKKKENRKFLKERERQLEILEPARHARDETTYDLESVSKVIGQIPDFTRVLVSEISADSFNIGFSDHYVEAIYRIHERALKMEELYHRKLLLREQSPLRIARHIEEERLAKIDEEMAQIQSRLGVNRHE